MLKCHLHYKLMERQTKGHVFFWYRLSVRQLSMFFSIYFYNVLQINLNSSQFHELKNKMAV